MECCETRHCETALCQPPPQFETQLHRAITIATPPITTTSAEFDNH